MAMGTRILKTLLLPLRALQLLLSLFIVGVASFHVYQFSRNHLHVNGGSDGQLPNALYAIEVVSCVAALYTLLTLLATCFGRRLFFLFTLFIDLLLTGGFIAIAILLRGSRHSNSCSTVESWSPSVPRSTNNLPASLYLTTTTTTADTRAPPRLLCNLDKACFALAIALAVLFPAAMALSLLALPGSGHNTPRSRRGSVAQKPFARASEETAYTNNSTSAPYEAPGFRGGGDGVGAPAMREYRAPAPYEGASELETARNGRFDPAVGGVQGGYAGRGQNF